MKNIKKARAIWYTERNKEIERRKNIIKEKNLEKEFNEFLNNKKISYNRALGLFVKQNNLGYSSIR